MSKVRGLTSEVKLKHCTKCLTEKPATAEFFYRDGSRADGFRFRCKECFNPNHRKHATRNYHKNKIKIHRRRKKSYRRNLDQRRSQARSYYHGKKHDLSFVLKRRLDTARVRALRKGLAFTITIDDLITVHRRQNGRCAVSGRLLEFGGRSAVANESPNALSLDRIDCAVGYTRKNVRLVTWAVNCAMRKWGDQTFIELCRDVVCRAQGAAV